MKIILHDYCGHPFQIDLSKELANRGYEVLHIFSSSSGGPKANFISEDRLLKIRDIRVKENAKNSFIRRAVNELNYGRKLSKIVKQFNPNLVISCNTPILAQKRTHRRLIKHNIPHIHWFQDIRSIAAKKILTNKFSTPGKIIAKYFEITETKYLEESKHIINITDDFVPYLKEIGISENKMTTILNWAPIHQLPLRGKKNPFSVKHGFDNKFVILYSGTLGMKHDPNILYETAKDMVGDETIQFVIVSEGLGMNYLKKRQTDLKLNNLTLLPYQPFTSMPDLLGSADILLTILDREAGKFSVPSKVLTGFCAERASVLMVPESNLAAKTVNKIEAGIVVKPGDKETLKKVILHLKSKPQMRSKMGKNARRYAEKNFNIKEIADKFENIIS